MNTLTIVVIACLAVYASAKPSGLWGYGHGYGHGHGHLPVVGASGVVSSGGAAGPAGVVNGHGAIGPNGHANAGGHAGVWDNDAWAGHHEVGHGHGHLPVVGASGVVSSGGAAGPAGVVNGHGAIGPNGHANAVGHAGVWDNGAWAGHHDDGHGHEHLPVVGASGVVSSGGAAGPAGVVNGHGAIGPNGHANAVGHAGVWDDGAWADHHDNGLWHREGLLESQDWANNAHRHGIVGHRAGLIGLGHLGIHSIHGIGHGYEHGHW